MICEGRQMLPRLGGDTLLFHSWLIQRCRERERERGRALSKLMPAQLSVKNARKHYCVRYSTSLSVHGSRLPSPLPNIQGK